MLVPERTQVPRPVLLTLRTPPPTESAKLLEISLSPILLPLSVRVRATLAPNVVLTAAPVAVAAWLRV